MSATGYKGGNSSTEGAKAVANLKEATELYLAEFPLEERRRPIITTFEVTEGATG